LSCCIAYMLAGPIINVVVIMSTWVAFKDHKINGVSIGPEMVGLRVGLGFVVACLTALVVHRQYQKYGNSLLTSLAAPPPTRTQKAKEAGLSLPVTDGNGGTGNPNQANASQDP